MIAFSSPQALFLRVAAIVLLSAGTLAAQATPDVLVLANGDTLHGKFVKSIGGTVTFHNDILGDLNVPWSKIKELHSSQKFAIIPKDVQLQGKNKASSVPTGSVDVENNAITVTGANAPAPIPTANAAFIVDQPTVDKLLHHNPGFFQAWNGAATLGGTIVNSSTRQYTYTAGVGLVRTVPSVSWLNPRNRTSFNFVASYGEITEPAYTDNTTTPPTTVPVNTIKSGIIHFDGEHDEYVSPRLYLLGQFALDHNYSLDLHLQQIYGGGLGVTAVKTPKQELDFKATLQYERQDFSHGTDYNLIGSTFAGAYQLHTKFFNYTQGVNYIPAWNDTSAWSFNEVNQVTFPAYKNLSFSIGTLDTYLNNPPVTLPPTVNNSFQFTFGLTYAIKSKYY